MIRRHGYSLVEVMIATTVLALGLLGLIALLAGSAVQQQTASLQNLSVGIARNAEVVLARQLGRPGGNFSAVSEGQWTFIPMDEDTQFLTVAPGYLLVPFKSDTVLMDRNFSSGQSPRSAPLPALSDSSSYFSSAPLGRLRHRRVDLEAGLTVIVETLRYNNATSKIESSRMIEFNAPTNITPGNGPVGLDEPSLSARMMFDPREQGLSGSAGISSYTIDSSIPGEFVNKITVGFYSWRNNQLISLADRLVTEPQEDFPGGKRPIMTYSALMRKTTASTQLCFFTYSCRALAKPQEIDSGTFRGLAFVPPDTEQEILNELGVLREVQVELGYERATQRYYFEIDATEEVEKGWVMSQGQVLLMSSRFGVVGGSPDPNDPGADFPVRIVSTRTDSERDKIQAFLDRSPRVEGRTPLLDLETEHITQPLYVWGIQPVVRSRTDGTEWALTPIEARVIQVADQ